MQDDGIVRRLRGTEKRSVVLPLERLMGYPMVSCRVEAGDLSLHGWYYLLEEGKVLVLDVARGTFVEPGEGDERPDVIASLQ